MLVRPLLASDCLLTLSTCRVRCTVPVGQIDEHSKGFHSFHHLHQLATPATVVNPSPTSIPVYLHARHIADDGTVTHPLTPMHTTQDPIVEQPVNHHFDRMADTLWLSHRHAWKEQASEWSPAYRRMLREKYGVSGYQVKPGPTVHVDDDSA